MRVDSACNSQRTRDSGVLDNMARHGIQNDRSRGERRRTHGRQLDAALGRGATIPPTTTTTFQGGASVPRGGAKCPQHVNTSEARTNGVVRSAGAPVAQDCRKRSFMSVLSMELRGSMQTAVSGELRPRSESKNRRNIRQS